MLPPAADRPKLRAILDQLGAAVEELLLGGLTTASEATKQTVSVAMQEAARFRLLRLGSALRVAAEELGRFTKQDLAFSRRRLTFFLNRAWLLGRGLAHALETGDAKEYDRLNWSPPTEPVPALDAVCMGVVKKVTTAAVMFEFRLRAIGDGQRLVWSAVFPVKPGVDIPAEGFLHLPQKQKFTPTVFLDRKVIRMTNAVVAAERVSLTDAGTVAAGEPFTDWPRFLDWSAAPARERLKSHRTGPLDLDTELQEEIVLHDYEIGEPADGDEPGQIVYPVKAGSLSLHALAEGKALTKQLDELRKRTKKRPPLFGLMHYERCRLVFQPLTTFADGPQYLTISKENINKAALLKAMTFT
jgi:hypothetical protein